MPGIVTSGAEISGVTRNGMWMLIDEQEFFLSFEQFPWFKSALVSQVFHVERPHPGHLYWPELDIDLAEESLSFPERFPLLSGAAPAR